MASISPLTAYDVYTATRNQTAAMSYEPDSWLKRNDRPMSMDAAVNLAVDFTHDNTIGAVKIITSSSGEIGFQWHYLHGIVFRSSKPLS